MKNTTVLLVHLLAGLAVLLRRGGIRCGSTVLPSKHWRKLALITRLVPISLAALVLARSTAPPGAIRMPSPSIFCSRFALRGRLERLEEILSLLNAYAPKEQRKVILG